MAPEVANIHLVQNVSINFRSIEEYLHFQEGNTKLARNHITIQCLASNNFPWSMNNLPAQWDSVIKNEGND